MTLEIPLAARESGLPGTAPRSLIELEPGTTATIVEVSAEPLVRERLLDLGFVPGTAITLVRRAPLGDPSVYELRGVQMCLRAAEASRISVQPTLAPGA